MKAKLERRYVYFILFYFNSIACSYTNLLFVCNLSIVFKQSCLFGNKRKLKALNKINNSEKFLELIKDCAENKNSWKDNDTLVLRIGVGVN